MDDNVSDGESEIIRPLMSPPPYDAIEAPEVEQATSIQRDKSNNFVVTCRVCQTQIDVGDKREQFVVKCPKCNEATPIQEAPKGKKYVRCTCNCLLVCKVSSSRIACPRPDCKRVITLRQIRDELLSTYQYNGMYQVLCAHCRRIFLFNMLQNALARCPHCRKVSSVGRFARGRGMLYLLIGGVLMVLVLIAFLVSGKVSQHPVFSTFYFVLFVVSFFVLVRSLYYCTMKVSEIESEPNTTYRSI